MSRPKRARAKSRVGQIHNCAACYADDSIFSRKLTWMLEDPAGKRHLRPTRGTSPDLVSADPASNGCSTTTRNQHLELLDPPWWNHPATEAQREYLKGQLETRNPDPKLREQIAQKLDTATKGQMSTWLELLEATEIASPTPRANEPRPPAPTVLTTKTAPNETVH